MGSLERPTPIERFVELIPLPYPWAALVWTVALGPVGGVFFEYLATGIIIYHFVPAVLYNSVSLTITLFYLFYIPRYLRLRLLKAEHQILPILPGGEEEYHAAFRRLTNPIPVILLAIPFLTPLTAAVSITVSISTAFFLFQYVVIAVSLGNFIWEYSISSWGLHKLGRSRLNLRSFLEDRMMGAKPVGNAALSATITFLGGILFLTLLGTSNPYVNGPGLYVAVALLIALGVVMFFLPLNSLHRKMQEEKMQREKELGLQFLTMTRPRQIDSGEGSESYAKAENPIEQLLRLKELEVAERKLAGTPTWPFDIQVIARLVTVVLSVTAVLLSRFITDYLIRI